MLKYVEKPTYASLNILILIPLLLCSSLALITVESSVCLHLLSTIIMHCSTRLLFHVGVLASLVLATPTNRDPLRNRQERGGLCGSSSSPCDADGTCSDGSICNLSLQTSLDPVGVLNICGDPTKACGRNGPCDSSAKSCGASVRNVRLVMNMIPFYTFTDANVATSMLHP